MLSAHSCHALAGVKNRETHDMTLSNASNRHRKERDEKKEILEGFLPSLLQVSFT